MLILICCEGSVDEDKVEIVDNNENNNNYYYVVSNSKSDDEANKDFFEEQVDKKNQSDPQDLAQSKSGARIMPTKLSSNLLKRERKRKFKLFD